MNSSPEYKFFRESVMLDPANGFKYNRYFKSESDLLLHTHDYYEMLFFPYDELSHLVNGTTFQLPKRSLVFIRPNDCHDFIIPHEKTVEMIHLGIRSSTIEKLFDYLTDSFPSKKLIEEKYSPYVILDSYQANEFLALLDQLNSIDVENKSLFSITFRSLLPKIFVQYFSDHNSNMPEESSTPEWLTRTCHEMKKLENFSLGLDKMVEISCHSKEHLCRSFKKYLGFTAMSYINDIRLTYIANMLIYTDSEIIDICYDSGYPNLSWMYSLFKKKYGVTPSHFRKTRATINNDKKSL